MKEYLVDLFREMPDWLKLVAFVILFLLLVGETVWQILSWREIRHLKRDLRDTRDDLKKVSEERDQLLARFESLNKVDSHVWTKPDAFKKNLFSSKSSRRARFVAISNLKGGVGKTTLTLNLGVTLALRGKRVLLLDLDFQGTLSNLALPIDLLKEYRRNQWTTDALFGSPPRWLRPRRKCSPLRMLRFVGSCWPGRSWNSLSSNSSPGFLSTLNMKFGSC